MKSLITVFFILIIINQGFSQRSQENQKPIIITPMPHDPGFKSRLKSTTAQSFYQSKDNWQDIIDSTWGPGPPLNEKLNIFNTYTQALTEKFEGFNSLGINPTEWDSIKNDYRSRINDSTSRGAFAALMGRLAYDLSDMHMAAWDNSVVYTPLNPGTPLLVIGRTTIEHFGAVLTALPDSTLLVLRTIENHPLDLQPGDIILGYEGVAWKDLIDELLEAGLPMLARPSGAKSALRHFEMVSIGVNWHLFETIDIIKYSSGDTVHLSVNPLIDLPVTSGIIWYDSENLMLNNEQLPVPGIMLPEAKHFIERAVNYGIVEGTNIGYIYLYNAAYNGLFGLTYDVDPQFYEAVSSLIETEGLIIDLRINYGGYADYTKAEALLFNQYLLTLGWSLRCNTNDFTLCPYDTTWSEIRGNPNSLYDRPLAVLLGPHCVSFGDITAYLLGYHPMVQFFGKPTCASTDGSEFIEEFPEWTLSYSIGDLFKLSDPETYLNRREFPVDVPVWFNADDVANGEDPVVNKAMDWIENLSYAHDVSVEFHYYPAPGIDTVTITAQVENPNSHSLSVKAHIISIDSLIIDSTNFFDDGIHNDGNPDDATWGALWPIPSGEETYLVSVSTEDTLAGSLRTLPVVVRFTSVGPIVYDGMTFTGDDTIFNQGDNLRIYLTLKNNSSTATATNIKAKLISLDTSVIVGTTLSRSFGDIAAGEFSKSSGIYLIKISEESPVNTPISILAEITSNGYIFWRDTFSILVQEPVNIEDIREPLTRIYPNPTNDILNIEINNAGQQGLEIEIFNITGALIYQKEYRNINSHFAEQIDLSGYTKGIYIIKVKQANSVYIGKVVVN